MPFEGVKGSSQILGGRGRADVENPGSKNEPGFFASIVLLNRVDPGLDERPYWAAFRCASARRSACSASSRQYGRPENRLAAIAAPWNHCLNMAHSCVLNDSTARDQNDRGALSLLRCNIYGAAQHRSSQPPCGIIALGKSELQLAPVMRPEPSVPARMAANKMAPKSRFDLKTARQRAGLLMSVRLIWRIRCQAPTLNPTK